MIIFSIFKKDKYRNIHYQNLKSFFIYRWLQEYEKSQMDNIDWSSVEKDDNIICPLCSKANLSLHNTILSCPNCKVNINTTKSMLEIKQYLMCTLEKHNSTCNNDVQFTMVPELNEPHVYLVCDACMDMQCVI